MLLQNFKVALMRFLTLYGVLFLVFFNNSDYHTSLRRLSNINSLYYGQSTSADAPAANRLLSGDSSSSEKSSEPHSIFGSLVMIDTKLYTVMIIIIVGMVLFIEQLFMGFHELSMDTPFHKMINAIEQELMNVGCTAFIFKVFLNINTVVDHDTYFALEFAGKCTII